MAVPVLWWQPVGNQVFFSKRQDVADPQRIKDKSVRVLSETMGKFVKLCGGKPTLISSAAMHDALKDGKIDIAMAGITTVVSRDLWKVSGHDHANRACADRIPAFHQREGLAGAGPGAQGCHRGGAKRLESRIREKAAEGESSAFAFAREKGLKIVELTSHQVAEWRACSSSITWMRRLSSARG